MSAGYRSDRVRSWLNPGNDPQDSGYQARQAKYALANGGIFGDGLGQGTAKWNYLPNAHNDFIFAIIGEELGLVGALGLLALFGLFAYTGMRIARRSADPFLRLLTATTTMWVIGQAFINIGYVIGLLPVTGMQLPLISAGGTSTATTLLMIGMMANAARHEPEAVAALRAGRDDRMNRLLRLPLPEPYAPTRVEALRDRLRSRGRNRPSRSASRRSEGVRAAGIGPAAAVGDRSGGRPAGEASWRRHSGTAASVTHTAAQSRTGRSALRVNDSVKEPIGEQGLPGRVVGRARGRRYSRPCRARDGRRRRAVRAGPDGPDHRAGHRARSGNQAGARARIPPRADHAGAAAPQTQRRSGPPAAASAAVPFGRPAPCSTKSTPTW